MNVNDYFPVDHGYTRGWTEYRTYKHTIECIPLTDLIASQTWCDEIRLEDLNGIGMYNHDPIDVTPRCDGKYVIRDGHHRAIFARLSGETEITARVYE